MEQLEKDPILFVGQIEEKYSRYGAVKLTIPKDWQPSLREPWEDYFLTVRQQTLSELTKGRPFSQMKESFLYSEFKQVAL